MMRRLSTIVLVAMGLAGCTSSERDPIQLAALASVRPADDNACTDIISTAGGILKFCQTADRVDVFESGVDLDQARRKLDVINDPEALVAIQKELHLRPDLKLSRKAVAGACVANGTTYVNISLKSMKAILKSAAPQQLATNDGADLEDVNTTSSLNIQTGTKIKTIRMLKVVNQSAKLPSASQD